MTTGTRLLNTLIGVAFGVTIAALGAPVLAQGAADPETDSPQLRRAGSHDISQPLREIARTVRRRAVIRRIVDPQASEHPERDAAHAAGELDEVVEDPTLAAQGDAVPLPSAVTPVSTFEGMGRGLAGYTVSVAPPDTVGAIGKDYFVQAVNSDLAVFRRDGTLALGPIPLVSLWSGFPTTDGNRCAKNNDGDPIVFYDQLADRWLVSQFDVSNPAGDNRNYQCLAVSTSSDPTGTWYRWDYLIPASLMGDYEKIGLWPDGYYMTIRGFLISTGAFQGSRLLVFDRAALLAGNPRPAQLDSGYLGTSEDGFTPMSLDGFTLPPVGAPGAVAKWRSQAGNRFIRMYYAKVNSNPDGTWNAAPTLLISAVSEPAGVATYTVVGSNVVPQPTTPTRLDTLSNNMMYRMAYRNFGTQASTNEHIVVNQTVGGGTAVTGVRWYELTHSSATGVALGAPAAAYVAGWTPAAANVPTVTQQQTYSPNATSRWMGSIGMDKNQNIGIGYNISSTTVFPGIAVTGRLSTDPASTLQAETVVQAGTDYQTLDNTNACTTTDLCRWGDYSQLTVDPQDNCTFWYTTEYLAAEVPVSHAFDWHTAVASFRFPTCVACTTPPTPTGVSVTANSTTSYTVNWAASTGATNYGVYRSLAACPGGNPALIATVASTSYTDATALAGTTYYYSVTAISGITSGIPDCESIRSTCVSSATGTCVQKPSFAGVRSVVPYTILAGGALSNNTCALHASWTAGTSNCPDNPDVSYSVYRSATPFSSTNPPAAGNRLATCVNGTTYDDATVSAATYYYAARAEDTTAGNGGSCNGGNEDVNTVTSLAGTPGNFTSIYYENFDALAAGANPAGWTPAGTWSGARACAPTYSASNIQRWGNTTCAGTYPQGAAGTVLAESITTGLISIPAGYSRTTLSIWHRWNFAGSAYDGGQVRVSVNAAAYAVVPPAAFITGAYGGTQSSGTAASGRDGCTTDPGGVINTGMWNGQQNTMTNSVIDLEQICTGGCAGKTIRLRFTGISNCTASVDRGWYIDDLQVVASTSAVCAAAPSPLQLLTVTSRNSQNLLSYINPAAGAGLTLNLRYRTDSYPTGINDGTAVTAPFAITAGTKGTTTHAATNGTTYYYAAYVVSGGAVSGAVFATGKPFAPAATGAQWSYTTGAATLSPPGGAVVAVSNDRFVHRVSSGALGGAWPGTYTPPRLNNPVQGRPVVLPLAIGGATNVMFLGAQDGRVHAIDADTGARLWNAGAGSALLTDAGGLIQASPSGSFTAYGSTYNVILVGTRNASAANSFVGLNPTTGATLWTFTNGGGATGIGIINGQASVDSASNKVYFASRARVGGSSGTLWCLDFTAATASLCAGSWPAALGNIDGGTVLASGVLYVGTNTGTVYAINATTGATIWSNALNDGAIKGYVWPVFFSAPPVFYVSTTNKVTKLTYNGGAAATVNWSATVAGASIPFYNRTATPYLYVGSTDGKLHQLSNLAVASPTDTTLTLGAGTDAVGSPAQDPSNQLDVGTDAGVVYSVVVPY